MPLQLWCPRPGQDTGAAQGPGAGPGRAGLEGGAGWSVLPAFPQPVAWFRGGWHSGGSARSGLEALSTFSTMGFRAEQEREQGSFPARWGSVSLVKRQHLSAWLHPQCLELCLHLVGVQ